MPEIFRSTIYDKYYRILSNIDTLSTDQVNVYSYIFTVRHKRAAKLPESIVGLHNDSLYYKDTLGKHSPYYVDLLKIEDISILNTILLDIIDTIKQSTFIYNMKIVNTYLDKENKYNAFR